MSRYRNSPWQPTSSLLVRRDDNPKLTLVQHGLVTGTVQLHIAAPAKHLQATMMLWLNMEASFHTEGICVNEEGNQDIGATKPEVKHEWRTAVVNGECENQPS